jgi:hypothetical protein
MKSPTRAEIRIRREILLTVRRNMASPSGRGANLRRWTMREEFASNSFLAVAVTGLVLLCSGLVAIAFT